MIYFVYLHSTLCVFVIKMPINSSQTIGLFTPVYRLHSSVCLSPVQNGFELRQNSGSVKLFTNAICTFLPRPVDACLGNLRFSTCRKQHVGVQYQIRSSKAITTRIKSWGKLCSELHLFAVHALKSLVNHVSFQEACGSWKDFRNQLALQIWNQ